MKRSLLVLILAPLFTMAQPPAGYYSGIYGQTCGTLKTSLKSKITSGHTNQGYSALWTQYQSSDVKAREVGSGSANVIWDIYSDNPTGVDPYNFTPGTGTGGQQDQGTGGTSEGQFYNREHSVPLSWHSGSTSSFSGSDYHHVFPTDKKVNAERANYVYGKVGTPTWTSMNGGKLGPSAVAGITGTVFEPIDSFKGDVARAFLYFVTRYEDNMTTWGSNADAPQAFEPNIFPSVDVAYLRLMLQWHALDPVSTKEINRNNAGYSFQGNRNPYVDSPQYVNLVWNESCPGLAALPVDLITFGGKLKGGHVELNWEVMNEVKFDRYEVERSFNGTEFSKVGEVKAINASKYSYRDNIEAIKGRKIYYRLKKVDKDGRFSYSPIFSLHVPLNARMSVYPNPASSFIKVQLNNNINGNVMIEISDMAGGSISKNIYTAANGLIELSIKDLPNASYLLKLSLQGEQFIQKIQVIN